MGGLSHADSQSWWKWENLQWSWEVSATLENTNKNGIVALNTETVSRGHESETLCCCNSLWLIKLVKLAISKVWKTSSNLIKKQAVWCPLETVYCICCLIWLGFSLCGMFSKCCACFHLVFICLCFVYFVSSLMLQCAHLSGPPDLCEVWSHLWR